MFCVKVVTVTEETEGVVVAGWEAMLDSSTEGAIVVAMEDSTRGEAEEDKAAAMTGVEVEDEEEQETITEADKMEDPKEDHTMMILKINHLQVTVSIMITIVRIHTFSLIIIILLLV